MAEDPKNSFRGSLDEKSSGIGYDLRQERLLPEFQSKEALNLNYGQTSSL